MKVKKYWDELLHADILFIYACEHVDLDKYMRQKYKLPATGFEALNGGVTAFEKEMPKGGKWVRYLVWVRRKDDFYCLLHETLHLAKEVFGDRGIPFDNKNDEMIAYYQEYWFKKFWRLMNKK